jgi:RHS repeat-associated protein
VSSGATQVYGFANGWKGVQLTGSSDSVLNQGTTYGYDEFNRLTSRTVNSGNPQNFTYVYDRWGNRWQQNVTAGSGPSPQLSFNTATNQIQQGPNCNPPNWSEYCYDAAGNMTADSFHAYTYDAEGNVAQVDGGATARYVYDALNHRVQSVTSSGTIQFVFNANGQRVSVWNGSTQTELRGQYYWGSQPVAFYAGGQTYFQHQDWLGTERLRTAYNGGVEAAFTSLPFGDAQTTASGTDLDPYHYATLDYDSETSTDHAQFRQYNSTEGRWHSPDPYSGSYDTSNPQSFNRYAYVLNMPLSGTDSSGQYCDLWTGCGTGDCANDPNCYVGDTNFNPGVYVPGNGRIDQNDYGFETAWATTGNPANYDAATGYIKVWISVWMVIPRIGVDCDGTNCVSGTESSALVDLGYWGNALLQFSTTDYGAPNNAPNNAPLTPEQLHKQQQTKLNQKCAAATASSAALATTAGLNEGAALLTGEITPFAAIFHGIAVVEGIGAGGVGIYAAFACYNAAQF